MKPWMKTTAVFLLGFLLGAAATGLALRQCTFRPPANNPHAVLERLSSKLHLTPEQQPKVEALLKEEMPRGEALRQETREKFKKLRESFDAKLRPLLTADQLKRLDRMNSRWANRDKRGGRFMGCGGPVSLSATPVTHK